jgi:NlpB/DapX lipoprotein
MTVFLNQMFRFCLGILLFFNTSCVTAYLQSVGGNTAQVFERIYLTDYSTAWQAVLESLKTSQLDVSNREGGFVQTKWAENTSEKNFSDSFGDSNAYLKAQYRFRITVAKGFYNGRGTVKVSVQKEQLVQQDVLEGWRPIETDSIDENTLLYRINRLIYIRTRLAKLEEEKAKKEAESFNLNNGP